MSANAEQTWVAGGDEQKVVAFSGSRRELPHSDEAEEALLSLVMLDGAEVMAKCQRARLHPNSFYDGRRAIVFEVLTDLYRQQDPMEAACVVEALRQRKQLEEAGGMDYLVAVSGRMATTAQADFYVKLVRDLAARRTTEKKAMALAEATHGLTGGGHELGEKLEQFVAWATSAVEALRSDHETMAEAAASALARTLAKVAGKADTSRQLFTGLREFDRLFGAFDVLEEDFLIGLGAATSNGKSSLSRNFADAFMRAGKKGIVFLLETTSGKWLELAAATAAGVNARELGHLPADLAEKFERELRARHAWVGERLWLCDDSMKAETLCARVDDHVRRLGAVDFVVVDHLHELGSAANFRGNRMQELSHIARLLKRTAKRLNVPFFVPMQLNRSPSKDGTERRPTKHDIRDCGEIENACDKMLLIHTPKTNRWGAEQSENDLRVMVELICAKSRNGRIGFREFWFERQFTRFVDIADRELNERAKAPVEAPGPGAKPSRAKYLGGQS